MFIRCWVASVTPGPAGAILRWHCCHISMERHPGNSSPDDFLSEPNLPATKFISTVQASFSSTSLVSPFNRWTPNVNETSIHPLLLPRSAPQRPWECFLHQSLTVVHERTVFIFSHKGFLCLWFCPWAAECFEPGRTHVGKCDTRVLMSHAVHQSGFLHRMNQNMTPFVRFLLCFCLHQSSRKATTCVTMMINPWRSISVHALSSSLVERFSIVQLIVFCSLRLKMSHFQLFLDPMTRTLTIAVWLRFVLADWARAPQAHWWIPPPVRGCQCPTVSCTCHVVAWPIGRMQEVLRGCERSRWRNSL